MSAQICPICKGTGKDPDIQIEFNKTREPCTVCLGKKIINSLTGKHY